MKNLTNIGKPVPEPADPPLIKPVTDVLEEIDAILGAPVGDLDTSDQTVVGAINELVDAIEANATNISLRVPATIPAGSTPGSFDDLPAGLVLADGANAPASGYWYVETFDYGSGAGKLQRATGYTNNQVYVRTFYDYVGFGWTAWREM